MDVESFPQVGLPIGQIMPPTRVGDYENANWQMQNLNHRRRKMMRRRRRTRRRVAEAATTTNTKEEAVPASEHVALDHSPNRLVGGGCTNLFNAGAR